MILQENFNNRKDFGNEIEILLSLFLGDYEITSMLNFFKTLDIKNLNTKENLLQKINKSLLVYEDDIDDLNYILYTGQGGQDRPGGNQIADQEFVKGNKDENL